MHEKSISKKVAFSGKIVSVEQHDVELEDGSQAYREIVRHVGSIGVLAHDPEGKFVFVRQFRVGSQKVMTEVVAGLVDPGEDVETAARRELAEETGCRAASLHRLGTIYASPGYLDEKVDAFYAVLEEGSVPQNLDHGERIEVIRMSRAEVLHAIRNGDIQDAKTLAMWSMFCEWEKL